MVGRTCRVRPCSADCGFEVEGSAETIETIVRHFTLAGWLRRASGLVARCQPACRNRQTFRSLAALL